MDSKSPMKVKGTGALALQAFITSRYEDRFTAWLDAMPPASRAIYGNPILAFELYSVEDSLILPTEAMCTLF